ncbi:MAG: rhodanese-like domain-containing protein [Pseudomonadota bacterium]
MKQLLSVFILLALSFVGFAYASEAPKEISVKEVQQFVDSKAKNVAILDANNDNARTDAGVVPGAILLTSYNQYALTELPKDKNTTLVFYCYNTYCQASHLAAQRAIGAGYKDARVMKAGIMGWNAAVGKT